jgi:hypothetical protein
MFSGLSKIGFTIPMEWCAVFAGAGRTRLSTIRLLTLFTCAREKEEIYNSALKTLRGSAPRADQGRAPPGFGSPAQLMKKDAGGPPQKVAEATSQTLVSATPGLRQSGRVACAINPDQFSRKACRPLAGLSFLITTACAF